ncbi:MAG TPA: Uma2 family endonuclease [Acetobacteraceae bacterium]|jgi:Uma2 family endonuclease|nr:Uma2 family endonuclease [Acetobacteraceae bacterium]
MSAALKPMTAEEFLAWEERQEERYEFDGFRPVAMTGGTFAHEVIGGNIRSELDNRLRGSRCISLGPNMKIAVAGRFRYPDAVVVCSPVDRKATVITDPVIVFEVLSDGTARIDQFDKLREYTATPSIIRYVILDQDTIGATVYARDGDRMVVETVARGGTLRLPEIDVEVPVDDLYRGVEPDQPDVAAAPG